MSILFCHDVKLVTFREFGINGTSYNYDIYMILERDLRSSPGSGTIPRSPLLQNLWKFVYLNFKYLVAVSYRHDHLLKRKLETLDFGSSLQVTLANPF
jgi:hypothetical protein